MKEWKSLTITKSLSADELSKEEHKDFSNYIKGKQE
jgi:hypothetical protein